MKPSLRLRAQQDINTQDHIEESIRGVDYIFFFTGRRQAHNSPIIELHITSTIIDWNHQRYERKSWYMGHMEGWKKCIENHVRQHLVDLGAGQMLAMRLMQDFQVKQEHYRRWEKYYPNGFH